MVQRREEPRLQTPRPWPYLAVAINETPLRLICSLQDHLHDLYVCQQQQEHWPGQNVLGATKKGQQRLKSIIQKGPTPEDDVLVSKGTMCRIKEVFLSLCFSNGDTHMHKDIPCRAIPITGTGIMPSQPQQYFSTSPSAKHLFLAIPWCCPCAAFPCDTEIRDWHQLLYNRPTNPSPSTKPCYLTAIFLTREILLIPILHLIMKQHKV